MVIRHRCWSSYLTSALATTSSSSYRLPRNAAPHMSFSSEPSKKGDASVDSSLRTSNKAKSLKPPTIANVESHERMWGRMRQLGLEDTEGMPSVADFPARIQEYAVTHSLRRSSEEMALQKATEDLPMAMMAGAPDEANFLCLLLELLDAKIVVEVGVFRGLTTLCLAQCLQKLATAATDHRVVIGLDVSEDYAAVGKEHWKLAGVEDYIDFRVGDAKESLSRLLESEDYGPSSVDLCFIDADKTSYDDYYEKCLKLTRPGGLIVVDNTIWSGNVAIPDLAFEKAAEMLLGDDAEQAELLARVQDAVAIKAINEKIHKDERIERVCFLTIADGVTVCRKK